MNLPEGLFALLDQPDPQRLGGAELLGGEQEAHRVAPAELRRCVEAGAAERHDPAADLQLAEAHVSAATTISAARASSIDSV